jgi:hypothetical protein
VKFREAIMRWTGSWQGRVTGMDAARYDATPSDVADIDDLPLVEACAQHLFVDGPLSIEVGPLTLDGSALLAHPIPAPRTNEA